MAPPDLMPSTTSSAGVEIKKCSPENTTASSPAAYKRDGCKFHSDGREIELLDFVFAVDRSEDIEGNPNKVIAAIDDFTETQHRLMNIGETRGRIVEERILQYIQSVNYRPIVMLELGAYVGYSAVMFGRLLPGGSKYISLEAVPHFAAVSTKMIELAGLSNFVKVLVGPAEETIPKLQHKFNFNKVDIVFLDHAKEKYLPDLKLLEKQGLVQPGTLVIADNVVNPGNPAYLEYVRGGEEGGSSEHVYQSELRKGVDFRGEDGVEISICIS